MASTSKGKAAERTGSKQLDLSHFIRTFRRATGVAPKGFRELASGDRADLQAMLGARCQLAAA